MMSKQIPVHDVTPPASKGKDSVDLYAAREKIYTRAFTGVFRRLRMVGGALLFLLYCYRASGGTCPSASSTSSAPPSGLKTSSCCQAS